MMFLFILYLSTVLVLLLVFISWVLSFTSLSFTENLLPFECGLNMTQMYHIPFSVRFFLLSLIFLIFDIELVLFLPLLLMNFSNMIIFYIIFMFFMIILMVGTIYEVSYGSLGWLY